MSSVEPRFKPGDQVRVTGGRGHVWRIVRVDHQPRETEPGYWLDNGMRQRTAAESALELAAPETTAVRDAWWERNAGG